MAFYDIDSRSYTVTFFIFAMIETLLCSGITYGWASIVVVFKIEKLFYYLCTDEIPFHNATDIPVTLSPNMSVVGGGGHFVDDGKLPGCEAQNTRLNLIYTIALFCLCGIKFPAGVFIDFCGPRIARAVGG